MGLFVGQAGCAGRSAAPVVQVGPDLDIPPLDGGAGARPVGSSDGIRFGHPLPVAGTAWKVSVIATSLSDESPTAPGGQQVSTYVSEYRVEQFGNDRLAAVPSSFLLVHDTRQRSQRSPTLMVERSLEGCALAGVAAHAAGHVIELGRYLCI